MQRRLRYASGSPADGKQFIGSSIDPGRPDLQVKWINARGEIIRLTIPWQAGADHPSSAGARRGGVRSRRVHAAEVAGRPELPLGWQSGEVDAERGHLWARTSREARFKVEWSTSPSFDRVVRVDGPVATEETPVHGQGPASPRQSGVPIHPPRRVRRLGAQSSPPRPPCSTDRSVLLAWSADVNGQGMGFDPARGGCLRSRAPRAKARSLFTAATASPQDVPSRPCTSGAGTRVHRSGAGTGTGPYAEGAPLPGAMRDIAARSASSQPQSRSSRFQDDHEVTDNWAPGDPRRVTIRRAMYEHPPDAARSLAPDVPRDAVGPAVDVFPPRRAHRTHPHEDARRRR